MSSWLPQITKVELATGGYAQGMSHTATGALDPHHTHELEEHGHSHGPLVDRSIIRSRAGIKAVSLTIFVSACVALGQTILRFIHPHTLTHLGWLAAAGVIGFVGNEIAAQIRTRAGHRLSSPALIADGNHARVDGFVSLGVVASAALVALGAPIADPIIGLVITLVILRITWQSWRTVSTTDRNEMIEPHAH